MAGKTHDGSAVDANRKVPSQATVCSVVVTIDQLTFVEATMKLIAFLVAFIASACAVDGFSVQLSAAARSSSSSWALQMTVLTYGSKKKDFKPGSPLKNACSALGVQPRYSCKK